jgi:hypothetical protein
LNYVESASGYNVYVPTRNMKRPRGPILKQGSARNMFFALSIGRDCVRFPNGVVLVCCFRVDLRRLVQHRNLQFCMLYIDVLGINRMIQKNYECNERHNLHFSRQIIRRMR